jgi:hypothetical protein
MTRAAKNRRDTDGDNNDNADTQHDLLRTALASLPDKYRTTLSLYYFSGLDQAGVASALGLPPGTIAARLSRSLKHLRERLLRAGVACSLVALADLLAGQPAYAATPALHASLAGIVNSHVSSGAVATASAGVMSAAKIGTIAGGLIIGISTVGMIMHHAKPVADPQSVTVGRQVVFKFDFEDGIRPVGQIDGEIVAGPWRDGNNYCVEASELPHKGAFKREVGWENPGDYLATFTVGMEVSFDCWYSGPSDYIAVCAWDSTQSRNVYGVIPRVAQGRWTRVTTHLQDWRMDLDPSRGFAAGDLIGNLLIAIESDEQAVLYVDNIEVTRP